MKWHEAIICLECWRKKHGDFTPRRAIHARRGKCCYCGVENSDGIYVRANAEILKCDHAELK